MDVVLGVAMGSTAVRTVLLEGENADGATIEDDVVRISTSGTATRSAPGQVISAILDTRQNATAGGYRLKSTGVAWTNPADAAALQEALADKQIHNVTLVSAFLAAAALTQTVGQAIGYRHTAMLLVDPNFATIAVVDSDDGSITGTHRQRRALSLADTVAQLAAMIARCDAVEGRPDGVFLVGQGVDTARLKTALETATPLGVIAPEEPATALARGAALASANAPLLVLSTGAVAYAQDRGTGEVGPYDDRAVAYSDVEDEVRDAQTAMLAPSTDQRAGATPRRRRPLLLTSSVLAVIFTCAAVALEIALAINIRTTVALRPSPEQNIIVPTRQAPISRPLPKVVAPKFATLNPPKIAVAAPAAPAPRAAVAAAPLPVPAPAPVALPPVPNIAPLNVPRHLQVPAAPLPMPRPPVALSIPKPPPLRLPTPKPPALRLPKPPALQFPTPRPPLQLPAPQPLRLPAPVIPKAPVLPAPSFPVFHAPAPVLPRLPALPRFPVLLPHFGL